MALLAVGRETEPGTLEQSMKKGLIHDYGMHELHIAFVIFRDLVEHDLTHKLVTVDILRLARDPPSALINIVERMQALDLRQMSSGDEANNLQEQVRKLMEESGKDPIDKETTKQIAIHLAVERGDKVMEERAKNNRALEAELIRYIGGTEAAELTDFPIRPKDAHQNDKLRRLEYYESDEEDAADSDKQWNFQDGMTSAIHSSASR